jgi:hypothetical protein
MPKLAFMKRKSQSTINQESIRVAEDPNSGSGVDIKEESEELSAKEES